MHERIQSYLAELYRPFCDDIKKTTFFGANETYGEIYYYSVLELLKHLPITPQDHFLDIGSGVGKLVLQIYFLSSAASVTGIEINSQRHDIAQQIKAQLFHTLPDVFEQRALAFLQGDFLEQDFSNISIVYVCSTIFSYDLLQKMGTKINSLPEVKQIVSFRKLPGLTNFVIAKKIFLHCSWDNVPCYLYRRKT